MGTGKFNYETKFWGGKRLELKPWFIQYLKLKWFLADVPEERGKLVDVGCGVGNLPAAIKERRPGLEVWGVDLAAAVVERAKKTFPEVKFKTAAADRLPFGDDQVTVVTVFDVLEHVARPEVMAGEINRVLKEGGRWHLSVPLEGQPGTVYWWGRKLGWRGKEKHCGHCQQFTRKAIEKLVESQGFEIEKERFSFHFLGQLYDLGFDLFLAGKLTKGLEEEIEAVPGGWGKWLGKFKDSLAFLGNKESELWQKWPGACLHLTARKIRGRK